ncbi:xanthine dehydrogenase family protein subunit M [soil metagenome]
MKAPAFQYCRPDSTQAACALLAAHAGDARILAGGQSMMAALNLRLSSPSLLIDINRIDSLGGIELSADGCSVRIGALARHAEVAASPIVARHLPLVALAMHHVAHPAVRNRGTTCGSLALADPSAEMPACAVTLQATLLLQSEADGIREVAADSFFFGLYETARRDDELLIEVRVPCAKPTQRFGFDELSRRHGDFAMVGVAVQADMSDDGELITDLRLVVFGTDPAPVLSTSASRLAAGQPWSRELAADIAAQTVLELSPDDNMFGTPAIKRRQAAALIKRVLATTLAVGATTSS